MKKIFLTLCSLIILTLGAQAFTYDNNYPSNNWRGSSAITQPAPTANGSAAAYQEMVNSSYYNNTYQRRHNAPQSPRKQRKHGSVANKYHH